MESGLSLTKAIPVWNAVVSPFPAQIGPSLLP